MVTERSSIQITIDMRYESLISCKIEYNIRTVEVALLDGRAWVMLKPSNHANCLYIQEGVIYYIKIGFDSTDCNY